MRRVHIPLLVVCLVTAGFAPVVGTAAAGTPASPATAPTAVSAADPAQVDGAAANDSNGTSNTTNETTGTTDGTAGTTDAGGPTTVTLLTYNDIQTAAAEDGNFSRLVTLIERRRVAHDNPTVVAGAGDQIGPHALSPVSQWRAPIAVLNEVDPAADVIGNHEFDYGYDEISNVTNASRFPWLATNVVNSTTGESFDGTENYTIVERDGVRVGFVGLVDRDATYGKTNINFSEEGATVENVTETGPEAARYLKNRRNVDVVVALAHTGVPDAKRIARADETDAIDVIAVGDDEIYYPPNETSGTVITEGVARAQYLGELNLTVEDGDVTAWNGRLIEVTNATPKNETASRIINEYRAEADLDTVVAESEVPLNATFSANYHRETNYGNLVTDAMRSESGADVAITNAGGIRSDSVYGPGNVTGGDVLNTLPFGNTLVTVRLSGAELEAALESQIVTLDSETGQQYGAEISQQVSGVRFEWNETSGEISDVYVNDAGPTEEADWEALGAEENYTVAVNSFIADGGSSYPLEDAPRVNETDQLLAETVIDYLKERGTVAPEVEGRMKRVSTTVPPNEGYVGVGESGDVVLRFDAPAGTESVREDSFVVTSVAADADPVRAESAAYDASADEIVLRFDARDLPALVASDGTIDLDLYGDYRTDASADRPFWKYSTLNADLTVSPPGHGWGHGDAPGAGDDCRGGNDWTEDGLDRDGEDGDDHERANDDRDGHDRGDDGEDDRRDRGDCDEDDRRDRRPDPTTFGAPASA